LREEINEVEVIADYNDQIKLDDLEEVSHDFPRHEYETIPSRDEHMNLDPQEEEMTIEDEDLSKPEPKPVAKAEPEDFTSSSEQDLNDREHMFEEPQARAQSFNSDENELSLCRNTVEDDVNDVHGENWMMLPAEEEMECHQVIEAIKRDFQEELDFWDATMVAEYSEEIFKYMEQLEVSILISPHSWKSFGADISNI
jgi:hypothetical protein